MKVLLNYFWVGHGHSTMPSLQQKVSMYAKWFHWILGEFIGCNEQGPVNK
jgi:hypothetical protein